MARRLPRSHFLRPLELRSFPLRSGGPQWRKSSEYFFFCIVRKPGSLAAQLDVLLISKFARECDLVTTRSVFNLTTGKYGQCLCSNAKKSQMHTVQIPEFLNALRKSGSPSVAASFSYVNSCVIFADRVPSATQARAVLSGKTDGKQAASVCAKLTRTGTFAEATRRQREGSPSSW